MIASELISYDILPLTLSDSGAKALEYMEEFKVRDIPVIDNSTYIGLVSESFILDREDMEVPLGNYDFSRNGPYIREGKHLFEVISLMIENDCSILPVVDQEEKFLGVITERKIIQSLSKMVSVASLGSTITIELKIRDYSLTEISKLVESDNAKILASFITSHPDSTKLQVTLKINKTDITRILHTFERFNYSVTASFNGSEYHKDLKDRYDAFMRFLNT